MEREGFEERFEKGTGQEREGIDRKVERRADKRGV